MLDRLLGAAVSVLMVATAIHVAIRLIESVAVTLVIIVAAIGGLIILGLIARLLIRLTRANRW